MLTASEVKDRLKPHKGQLAGMKVKRLSLFGSAARGEARADSDLDFLVEFDCPVTFDLYFDLKHFLEDLLGASVDLVTIASLKETLKPYIEKDMIDVA